MRELLLRGDGCRAVGRGGALRGGPRPARRRGDPAGPRPRRGRRLRPLHRLLARLPGTRARPRCRARARAQPARHRRACCPTAPSSCSSRSTRRLRASRVDARPHRARGRRVRRARSTAPTASWRRSSPQRIVTSWTRRSRRRKSPSSDPWTPSRPFLSRTRRRPSSRAALAEGPAHAYLFHGPRGVGKRRAALAFAGELLGDAGRVARRAHPDLYLLEPLGDQIRIDPIRDAPPRPAHAPVRGRAARLPRLRRRT